MFQFAGPLPATRSVHWVGRVFQDPSGKALVLPGEAFVRVLFSPAIAHVPNGEPTYGGHIVVTRLPVLRSLKMAGDFENVLSFGLGVGQKTSLHAFSLTSPSRFVIDFGAPAG